MPSLQRTSYHKQRIAGLIHQKVSLILQKNTHNSLFSFVSISRVTLSSDLAYADFYISLLTEDSTTIHKTLKALNHAKNYLRFALAKIIKIRIIPELRFFYDSSIVNGFKMVNLIDAALERSEKRA